MNTQTNNSKQVAFRMLPVDQQIAITKKRKEKQDAEANAIIMKQYKQRVLSEVLAVSALIMTATATIILAINGVA